MSLVLQPTKAAEFSEVLSIQTLASACDKHTKAAVTLKISKSSEPVAITCSNIMAAESIASLIDGYCRLFSPNNSAHGSLWNRKGNQYEVSQKLFSS